jgi:succinate-semialdehyde dehydrogenase/glutarate-semialdehyde dehydrogenase
MSLRLSEPGLLRRQAFIGGLWLDADDGSTLKVLNPASGETLGTVPNMSTKEARRAIEAASSAFPEWAGQTAKARGLILRRMHHLMLRHVDDLAFILTAEQGKPLAESRGEIAYAASVL